MRVPAGQLLVVDATTDVPYGWVEVVLPSSACTPLTYVKVTPLSPAQLTWLNDNAVDVSVHLRLSKGAREPASVTFHLTSRLLQPSCGDGYLDTAGAFGALEACDDSNQTSGDGCSSDCALE